MVEHDAALRRRLAANLAGHPVSSIAVDHRHRAAVAIVIVDSEPGQGEDLPAGSPIDMSDVPGDTTGFDGRIEGVSGGAAFLLCRRAARMNRHAGQFALPG